MNIIKKLKKIGKICEKDLDVILVVSSGEIEIQDIHLRKLDDKHNYFG